jgi:hypothetical protein
MKFAANLFHHVKKTANHVTSHVGRESAAPPAAGVAIQDSNPETCDSTPVTFWSALSSRLWGGRNEAPSKTATAHPGGRRPKCTACRHPERFHLDQALVHGATLEPLAKAYGLSVTSLHRHKQHLSDRLRQAAKALDEVQQLDHLLCLARNLHRLEVRMDAAALAGDDQAMCRLNREMHRNLKAMDKIDFRFRSLDAALLFQTVISPDWPEQVTALPTDPAVMAAYRRLVVQGLAEACPPPPKTAKPPQTRHHVAPPPSPVSPDHHVAPPPPAVHGAPPPPPGPDPAAASASPRPKHISRQDFRHQARQFVSRLKQAAANVLPPAPLNPELSSELNFESEFLTPELSSESNFELGTLNFELSSEPNSELKKTTGKQPENFPLPKALSLHLADVALSQLADNPDFYSFDDDPLAPEKNYRPQAENSPAAPAPAAPDLPPNNQELRTNNCPSNNQQLRTNNCPSNCFYDSWDPAHQAEPLWTRPFLTPAEVSSLPPTIPADILAIADIHPIFLKPYLDPKAEHLKGTPFREAPPPSEVPRAAEEPKEQPKPEPSRAEIMMDMTRRLSAMIRGEADEPVGPCRRPRRYSRRGHWDDW